MMEDEDLWDDDELYYSPVEYQWDNYLFGDFYDEWDDEEEYEE